MTDKKKRKIDELLDNPESTGSCSENEPCGDPNLQMPSATEQAKSLSKEILNTTSRFFTGQQVRASIEVFNERIKICKECPFAVLNQWKKLRCLKCGCFMDVKARLQNAECPEKKWRE